MKRDLAALSMFVFGALIIASGLAGLKAPGVLLFILNIHDRGAALTTFVMASSEASLAMGLYYIMAAIHNARVFFVWSIPARVLNFLVFTLMVMTGIAPLNWMMVAGLELFGALATGLALLLQKDGREFDVFNAIRIASIALALIGSILVFQWGVYASMSAFLVISSAGFIYAYQRFDPGRDLSCSALPTPESS